MGKKLRIAFVSNDSWGLFNFRLGVIRKLRDLGYEIILIAGEDSYSDRLIEEGYKFYPIKASIYSTNPVNDIKYLWQLFYIYKKTSPDFIFHYTIKPNIYGSIAAEMLNIPSIAVVAGLGLLANHEKGVVRHISILLYKVATAFSKEVWFLNQSDKDFFLRKSIVSQKKVHILPGEGVDTQRFSPSPFLLRENPLKIIFAGRMIWAKGLYELAIAAEIIKRKYPNVTFQLLGFINQANPNSISKNQLEDWHRSGLFEYLGETDDVVPYLKNSDCIILPSFYAEGLSRILLEAASLGKFIIATDIAGCREIVEHGETGFLCNPRNSDDLYKRIEDFILLTPEERKMMGLNARKKVESEFDERIVKEEYVKTLMKYKLMIYH